MPLFTAIKACGWPAWAALLAALISFVAAAGVFVAAILRVQASRVLAFVTLAVALLPAVVGIGGTMLGLRRIEQALDSGRGLIDPSQEALIREEGGREARMCTSLGLGFSGLPALVALTGLVIAMVRKPLVRGR